MNKTKTIIISKKITYSFFKERLNKLVNIDKKFTSRDFIPTKLKNYTYYSIPYQNLKMIEYYLFPFKIYLIPISQENYLIKFSFRRIMYTYNMETNQLNNYVL